MYQFELSVLQRTLLHEQRHTYMQYTETVKNTPLERFDQNAAFSVEIKRFDETKPKRSKTRSFEEIINFWKNRNNQIRPNRNTSRDRIITPSTRE
jgi:hypothetical protein